MRRTLRCRRLAGFRSGVERRGAVRGSGVFCLLGLVSCCEAGWAFWRAVGRHRVSRHAHVRPLSVLAWRTAIGGSGGWRLRARQNIQSSVRKRWSSKPLCSVVEYRSRGSFASISDTAVAQGCHCLACGGNRVFSVKGCVALFRGISCCWWDGGACALCWSEVGCKRADSCVGAGGCGPTCTELFRRI